MPVPTRAGAPSASTAGAGQLGQRGGVAVAQQVGQHVAQRVDVDRAAVGVVDPRARRPRRCRRRARRGSRGRRGCRRPGAGRSGAAARRPAPRAGARGAAGRARRAPVPRRWSRPGPTATPCRRSAPTKSTRWPASPCASRAAWSPSGHSDAGRGLRPVLVEAQLGGGLDGVGLVLEDHAQRGPHGVVVEGVEAEGEQGAPPVDRLGDRRRTCAAPGCAAPARCGPARRPATRPAPAPG